jgi:putative FmdB family regulatory protein
MKGMPIYEYKCEHCGSRYEQIRRMADADRDLECPECKSNEIKRQLSSFATSSGSDSAPMPMGGCGKPTCGMGGCGFN